MRQARGLLVAPMVGGMISTTVLGLVVLPAIYLIWKGISLRRGSLVSSAEPM